MIIAKVWGLPPTEEARLNELYKYIAEEIGIEESEQIANFTKVSLVYGGVNVGEEIIIEIDEKTGRGEMIQNRLSIAFRKVVRAAFPKANTEWYILSVNPEQAYWPSPCDDGNTFALDANIYT